MSLAGKDDRRGTASDRIPLHRTRAARFRHACDHRIPARRSHLAVTKQDQGRICHDAPVLRPRSAAATTGIEVVWRDDNGQVEIEYFAGIDVDHLDSIPRFESVPAVWPLYEGGTCIEYKVRARTEPGPSNRVHLVVEYHEADNPELARAHDLWWGTNRIILTPGERQGHCHWRRSDGRERTDIRWTSFDLAAAQGRPRAAYLRSRRYGQFRCIILAADGRRCVLTGESTTASLEAAHLVPAKLGENDKPFNGIALRADLHRLFDAGLFTFAEDGEVVLPNEGAPASGYYRSLLRGRRLPDRTLRRVRDTLALSAFKNRQ